MNKIEKYFDRYGWRSYRVKNKILYSGWSSENCTYTLKVQFSNSLIFFEVHLVEIDHSLFNHFQTKVLKLITELNAISTMVKITLDEDQTVVLQLETFSNDFNYQKFEYILGILGHYSDATYLKITKQLKSLQENLHHTNNYIL